MRDDLALSVWIDDRGSVHDERETSLADMIDAQPHQQLGELAVEVLFWATVVRRDLDEEIWVKLAASSRPATVGALLARLRAVPPGPVAIKMWDERERWLAPVRLPSPSWACVFLERWYAERGMQSDARPVDFEPIDFEVDGERVRDNQAIAFWRGMAGQRPLRMAPALRLSGLDRTSVVVDQGGDGEWRISLLHTAGFAFWFYPRVWRMFAIDQVVQNQPDQVFGSWVRDQVVAADRAGRPRWLTGAAYVRAVPRGPVTCVRDELIFAPYSDGKRRSVVMTFERTKPLFAAG